MARKQDEKGVLRVDAGKGFAVMYSYANFEGGAWRGEGAFEAATLTAQLDVGGRLNRAAERPVEFPTSSLPFAPEQAVTR